MKKKIIRIMEKGVTYAPPSLILGISLLNNLTLFQRQILILLLLVWVNVIFLFNAYFSH